MPFLQPDYTFLSYREITADFLREAGISALILDIDNTLAPYEQPEPDESILAFLAMLREAGVRAGFLSNNHGPRVARFNAAPGLPVRCEARKPLTRAAKRMMRELGGSKRTTAFLGDQIFTDVLCAKACGARAILVPPIRDRTDRFTRFKRRCERGVLRRYYRRRPDAPDVRAGSPLARQAEKGQDGA